MTTEAEFETSLRRGRRTKLLALAAILIAPFAYLGYRIWHGNKVNAEHRERAHRESLATPAELAELEQLLPELRKKIQAASAAIKADVTVEAVARAIAGDGGRCPYDIAREFGLKDDLGKQLAMMHHMSPVTHVEALPLSADGLGLARIHLADGTDRFVKHEATHDDVARVRQDAHDLGAALIVIGETVRARTFNGEYFPGHTEGDAILYLYRARKIVCAAHISVSTPEAIMVEYRAHPGDMQAGDRAADAMLEAALYDAEVAALSKELHAIP